MQTVWPHWKDRECHEQTGSGHLTPDGLLTWNPQGTTVDQVVEELSLLLTGGRLNSNAAQVIKAAYESKRNSANAAEALKVPLPATFVT